MGSLGGFWWLRAGADEPGLPLLVSSEPPSKNCPQQNWSNSFQEKKIGEKLPVLSHRQVPSGLGLVRKAEEKVGKFSLFFPRQSLVSDPS